MTFMLAVLIAVPLTQALRRLALRLGVVAQPRHDRVHERPTPYLGGVAVATAATAAATVGWLLADSRQPTFVVLILAAGGLVLLGLLDDLNGLGPWLRVATELALATALVVAGARLNMTGVAAVDGLLSVLAIVVLTNSYNLLDNSDGALAAVAIPTGLAVVAIAIHWQVGSQALLAAGVAGALAGFLLFNWPPAKIFLGDAGSLFIGLALVASLAAVDGASSEPNVNAAMVMALFVVPAIDTCLVVITRVREGRSVLSGGKDHLHHRIGRTALGVPGAALLGALLSASGALLAFSWAYADQPAPWWYAILAVLYVGPLAWALHAPSGHEVHPADQAVR